MWLYRPVFIVVSLLVLAACGFQPMYGSVPGDGVKGGPTSELSRVQVAPIKDRIGQQLHTHLTHKLGAGSRSSGAKFRLDAELSESTSSTVVQKTAFASRANLNLSVRFRLLRIADGATLLSGNSRSTVSYNIFNSEFATIVAEKDAIARAVRALAENIRTRVSVYFDRPLEDREQEPRENDRKTS